MKNIAEKLLENLLSYLNENRLILPPTMILLPILYSYFKKSFTDLGKDLTIEDHNTDEQKIAIYSKDSSRSIQLIIDPQKESSIYFEDYILFRVPSIEHLTKYPDENGLFKNNLVSKENCSKFLLIIRLIAGKFEYKGEINNEDQIKQFKKFLKNEVEKSLKEDKTKAQLGFCVKVVNRLNDEIFPQKFLIDHIKSCGGRVVNKLGKTIKTVNESEYAPDIKASMVCGTLGSLILGVKYLISRNTGINR